LGAGDKQRRQAQARHAGAQKFIHFRLFGDLTQDVKRDLAIWAASPAPLGGDPPKN
jgi:hypothetical protein